MNIKDYVEKNEFGSDFETFPQGDTFLKIKDTEVEPMEVEFDGKKKTRYKLTLGDKTFVAGIQVLEGIKKAVKLGADEVRITRTGEGKETRYTVVKIIK